MPEPAGVGVTTFGDAIQTHIQAIEDDYKIYNDNVKFLELMLSTTEWRCRRFMFVYVQSYCKEAVGEQLPAEFGITVFDFKEGVLGVRSGLVDPGYVPLGQRGDTMETVDSCGLPFPGRFDEYTAHVQPSAFITSVHEMAEEFNLKKVNEEILVLSNRRDMDVLQNCINWIEKKYEMDVKFHIICIETLLRVVSRKYDEPTSTNGVINHDGGAARFLFHPRYDYLSNLSCSWHQKEENLHKFDRCARSISQRIVYNIMYYFCKLFSVKLVDKFLPPKY